MVINGLKLLKSQHEFITCKDRLRVIRSGIGGGKTRTLVSWALERALKTRRLVLTEPTFGMVRDILIPTFDEMLNTYGLTGSVKFNKSNRPELYLPNGGYIALRSCENPDSSRGPNYHDFGMDEVSYVKSDEASITMSYKRLIEMYDNIDESFLALKPWEFIHKRMEK